MSDILAEARRQVLHEGRGLDEGQAARCLSLPRRPPGRGPLAGPRGADALGNYLTTLGRPARADLDMLTKLKMPIRALSTTL